MSLENTSSSSSDSSSSSSDSSSSTSVDTSSIAASVMADIEAGGSGNTSTETKNVDTTAAPVDVNAAKEAAKEIDPDDFDAVPAEVTDALGRKRANSIPHPRVKTMVARAQNKIIAAVAKELGITKAEAELKLEDVTGALTERNTKFKSHEDRIAVVDNIENIIATDENRFIRMLAEADPARYGRFAKLLDQAQTQQQQVADDDPEPLPDYPLTDDPNGPKTYSMEQLSKARAWDRRQAKKEALKDVDARFKPIEDERKANDDRKKAEEIGKRAEGAVKTQLEKAKKWHGFEENAPAILTALKANPAFDLFDAYQSVVMPKLAATRQQQRDEILAEQNAQPRSTSAATTAAATKPAAGKDTASIARDVMREMGGG